MVFEIMPYFTNHVMYRYKALASGITYMGFQCHKGAPQVGDELFENFTSSECMMNKEYHRCKYHFLHKRKIDLVDQDVLGIRELLRIGKEFVIRARNSTGSAGVFLKELYLEKCLEKEKKQCRSSLIQSPLAGLHTQCIVEFDCGN